MFERQVWIHWWRADDGKVFERLEVRKFHCSPSCQPNPESFEPESVYTFKQSELKLAA